MGRIQAIGFEGAKWIGLADGDFHISIQLELFAIVCQLLALARLHLGMAGNGGGVANGFVVCFCSMPKKYINFAPKLETAECRGKFFFFVEARSIFTNQSTKRRYGKEIETGNPLHPWRMEATKRRTRSTPYLSEYHFQI
ncbi:hypothetical protein [Hoylesella buccalis]|uniref:hypothetical protein n=1 Tax=Hoylesella buccalis TaxID=28127 RepID=UPI00138A1D76|nr:hypothetical protein [Hoylesella buccalis]